LILPNTDEIKYAYNDKGRLVSMTDWDNQTSTFQYDKLGRHVGTQRSNGFTSKYAYNKAGHLQELRHGEGWNTVKTLQSFVYETDARGNRSQVKEVSLRDTADSSVTMAHDDESIVYSGDWDANGSFHETTETNAKLAVMFYGNTGINLRMETGDDCGIYDSVRRVFRPPTAKPNSPFTVTGVQANFVTQRQYQQIKYNNWREILSIKLRREDISNGHIDISG